MSDRDYQAEARELLNTRTPNEATLERVAARLQADAERIRDLEAQLAAARDAGVQREEAYLAAVKEAHRYKAELLGMQSRLEHAERQNELRSKALGIVARRERQRPDLVGIGEE